MSELLSDFAISRQEGSSILEVWVEWVPAIDGGVYQPVSARREGADLVVWVNESTDAGHPRTVRRLTGLNEEVLAGLAGGVDWIVCGPSGALSRRRLTVENA